MEPGNNPDLEMKEAACWPHMNCCCSCCSSGWSVQGCRPLNTEHSESSEFQLTCGEESWLSTCSRASSQVVKLDPPQGRGMFDLT